MFTPNNIPENIDELLIKDAREYICDMQFDEAVKVYTQYGISKQDAYAIIRGEKFVKQSKDTEYGIVLSTDNASLSNKRNNVMWNWDVKAQLLYDHIVEDNESVVYIKKSRPFGLDINYYDLHKSQQVTGVSANSIVNAIINNTPLYDIRKLSRILNSDINELPTFESKCTYVVSTYMKCIYYLYIDLMKFLKNYEWMREAGLVKHIRFVEDTIETSLKFLKDFIDAADYNTCKGKFSKYIKNMRKDILTTKFGKEYFEHEVLKKDFLDGYNAGWLAPNGDFYGSNEDERTLIHLTLSDIICKFANIKILYNLCGIKFSEEHLLSANGWMKVHFNEVYGSYRHNKDDDKTSAQLYTPTNIQVDLLANYADKFYNGIITTGLDPFSNKVEIKSSRLRQADEIQLHEMWY